MNVIKGYAWTWDVPVERFGYQMSIRRGAFRESIRDYVKLAKEGKPPRLLIHHDDQRIPVGVLRTLREDSTGLYFEAVPIATQDAMDAVTAIEARAIHGPSISFDMGATAQRVDEKAMTIEFTRVPLREISAVVFPAHPAASMWVEDEADPNQNQPPEAGAATGE